MRRFSGHLAVAFFLIVFYRDISLFALQPGEALELSSRTGKPLLALGTNVTCPPCQALKHHLRSEPSLRGLLEGYVVVNMDSNSPEFHSFVRRFPAEVRGLPMVYVIRPDGAMLYGRAGGIPPQELQNLLRFGLEESGEALDSKRQQRLSAALAASHRYQQEGELLKALQVISAVMPQRGYAASVRRARVLRQTLTDSLRRRLAAFDEKLIDSASMHGAAFRLAEMYIGLSVVPQLRESAGAKLIRFEQQESTRLAILQGKELVRARYFEQRELCERALSSYERIIQIDKSSPTARHASQKIAILTDKQRQKLATRDHGSPMEERRPTVSSGMTNLP